MLRSYFSIWSYKHQIRLFFFFTELKSKNQSQQKKTEKLLKIELWINLTSPTLCPLSISSVLALIDLSAKTRINPFRINVKHRNSILVKFLSNQPQKVKIVPRSFVESHYQWDEERVGEERRCTPIFALLFVFFRLLK